MVSYHEPPFGGLSVWRCFVAFCQNWWGTFTCVALLYSRWQNEYRKPGYCYSVAPWYVVLVHLFYCAPLFAFEQAYVIFWLERQWPFAPTDWAHIAWSRVGDWCDSRATSYAWLPADSGQPGEIGFHYRSDLLTLNRETMEYEDRPRIFVTASSDVWINGQKVA